MLSTSLCRIDQIVTGANSRFFFSDHHPLHFPGVSCFNWITTAEPQTLLFLFVCQPRTGWAMEMKKGHRQWAFPNRLTSWLLNYCRLFSSQSIQYLVQWIFQPQQPRSLLLGTTENSPSISIFLSLVKLFSWSLVKWIINFNCPLLIYCGLLLLWWIVAESLQVDRGSFHYVLYSTKHLYKT